jgi:hypothetical protein
MITPFKTGNRITQKYKNNPTYYAQFGLKGHEGLDLVPLSGSWDIFCIEGGEIIKDIDDPRGGGAYGNNVVIWNKANKRAWYYCHMASNQVSNKQTIRRGDKIGVMGATGNTKGAHLHLNLCETDENGVRLNKDNGYLGFIDPLPVLEELNKESVIISPPVSNIDYKAIFDKTGDQLPDRALKDDSFFQTDKLYKDNGIPYVTLTADSVNHFMSEYRKFRDIANTPTTTPPNAPQSGDNFEAVTEPPLEVKPDLPTYPATEFEPFEWIWNKISSLWKR